MLTFSKMTTDQLRSREFELTLQLRHPIREHAVKIDLERHQIELELQNRELKLAVDELEASRSRYAELFDVAPFAYLQISHHGIINSANLQAVRVFGRQRHMLLGKPLALYFAEQKTANLIEFLRNCKTSPRLKVMLRRKANEEIIVPAELWATAQESYNGYQVAVMPLIKTTCQNCRHWQLATNDDEDLPDGWGWCKMMDRDEEEFDYTNSQVLVAGIGAAVLTAPTFGCIHHDGDGDHKHNGKPS